MAPLRTWMISASLLALASAPAFAGRYPDAAERQRIDAALTAAGFSSWGEIELDDHRVWDVEDALHADGMQYDLDLDLETLQILKQERD